MSAALSTPPDAFAERFEEAVRLHVRQQSQAPLRIQARFAFESSPEELFAHLNEPELIPEWFGMVRAGTADHSQSSKLGSWGVGSKRSFETSGMGTLHETVHHYEAPSISVYSAHSAVTPVVGQVGLLLLEPTPTGCVLEWSQFFDVPGFVLKHVLPKMIAGMMKRGLTKLQKKLGGEGGSVEVVG